MALHLRGGLRVTVLGSDGTVLADNVARLPLENHGNRPEVLQAIREGTGTESRFSASTGYPTLYFAKRIDGPKGILGFLRVSEPLERVEEEVRDLRNAMVLGGAAALLFALLVSALVARWVERPLHEVERTAARFAGGELDVRAGMEGPAEVQRLAGNLNRMADQVRDRMRAEGRVRANLESVLAGVVEGVVAVDGSERILFMNGAAARLLGLPGALPAGGKLWEAVRFPEFEDVLRAVLRGIDPGRRDVASPGKDGRTLEIVAGPLGAGEGAVAVIRDVTEVRRLEKIRMDFVANVSHELRTPLSGIAGALETLEGDDLDSEERKRFHGIARRNADRLGSLVADLLDLSGIESEGTSMPLEPLSFDQPARAAVSSLSAMAERCRVAVTLAPPPPGLVVNGNARRLEQAFSNLVENALKYTPAGGTVTVRFRDGGDYRVDPSRSRQMGGTGLGLAIVKHIARAHRGRIEVQSTEGAGSSFTLTLPRRKG